VKLKNHHELDQTINERPDLVVLAGESGSGKSTLIDLLRLPDNKVFTESYALIDEVKRRGQPVNHDTIYAVAKEFYEKDPLWQVPNIMAQLALQGYLVWDGPRRVQGVLEVQGQDVNTTIVRVSAYQDIRQSRLAERDGNDEDSFLRIVHDESEGTGLNQILDLANITIHNNRDLRQLELSARTIRGLLKLDLGRKDEG
jgi:dephospho-CoA kinase